MGRKKKNQEIFLLEDLSKTEGEKNVENNETVGETSFVGEPLPPPSDEIKTESPKVDNGNGGSYIPPNTGLPDENSAKENSIGIEDQHLLEALEEFCHGSLPQTMENLFIFLKLKNIDVNPPSVGASKLWARSALPFLKKHFPNFNQDYVFYFMSFVLLGGMVKIKNDEK